MSDRPQVELEHDEFRAIPMRPLGKAKDLRFSIVVWAISSAACAIAAWQIGTWWAAFLPIAPAIWLGAAFAGLFPYWFFGKTD